eukprot:761681-Hanusia_phi.AAC.1
MERISDGETSEESRFSSPGLFQNLRQSMEMRPWMERSWWCSCSSPRNSSHATLGFIFADKNQRSQLPGQQQDETEASNAGISHEDEQESVDGRRKCIGLIMKTGLKG